MSTQDRSAIEWRTAMSDTPENLLRKIRLGEDTALKLKSVAFKGDRLSEQRRDDLADEIAAIANTADGTIVFGVDDKSREIRGISLESLDVLERAVFEICTQSIRPPVLFKTFRM